MRRRGRSFLAVTLAVAAAGAVACGHRRASPPDLVVGVPEGASTSTSGPRVITGVEGEAAGSPTPIDVFVEDGGYEGGLRRPEPPAARGLTPPDGGPWPAPVPFTSAQAVPDDLVFILVAGSDARPREELSKTRADSIHLLAVNPKSRQGTLLGLPRDAWVEIPGHGRGKINNALALGGPDLLAAAVRRLTGLPVHYYVLTGFRGLARMVDELGGVDVFVERRMNDRVSGARFERGWHRFSGPEALAFTRNRNDVANGDFSRSEHQGVLILAGLAKMRAEVADDEGVARWAGVLLRHARLDMPLDRLPTLGALARRLDPGRLRNVVAPGRIAMMGGQSVVFLTTAAARLFDDLRPDAVIGEADAGPPPEEETATTATAPSTTTSTSTVSSEETTTSTAPSTTSSTRPGVPDLIGGGSGGG
jgi:LCP family protein required for cell wall assembly